MAFLVVTKLNVPPVARCSKNAILAFPPPVHAPDWQVSSAYTELAVIEVVPLRPRPPPTLANTYLAISRWATAVACNWIWFTAGINRRSISPAQHETASELRSSASTNPHPGLAINGCKAQHAFGCFYVSLSQYPRMLGLLAYNLQGT